MHRTVIVATLFVALALPALAAGSKPASEEDDSPWAVAYNEGVDLMKKGQFAEAQARFETAIEADDSRAEAYNNLGYSLRKQGAEHYDAAKAQYDRAIEIDPRLAEAYMYRGVLHALAGNEDAALADHGRLVELGKRRLAEALMQTIASGEEPEGHAGLVKARW